MRMPLAMLSFDLLPFFTPTSICAAKETRPPAGRSHRLRACVHPDGEAVRGKSAGNMHTAFDAGRDDSIENVLVDNDAQAWCDIEDDLTVTLVDGQNRADRGDCRRAEVELAAACGLDATGS